MRDCVKRRVSSRGKTRRLVAGAPRRFDYGNESRFSFSDDANTDRVISSVQVGPIKIRFYARHHRAFRPRGSARKKGHVSCSFHGSASVWLICVCIHRRSSTDSVFFLIVQKALQHPSKHPSKHPAKHPIRLVNKVPCRVGRTRSASARPHRRRKAALLLPARRLLPRLLAMGRTTSGASSTGSVCCCASSTISTTKTPPRRWSAKRASNFALDQ